MKNLFKYASLLVAAVMLYAACESVEPEIKPLSLQADKECILADGKDSVKFTVLENGVDATASYTIYYKKYDQDGDGVALETQDKFAASEPSIYVFYVMNNNTQVSALVPATKSGKIDRPFRVESDRDVIQSNGTDYADVKVYLADFDVTAYSDIYDADFNRLNLENGHFTTTAEGDHKLWAAYGTFSTYDQKKDDNGLFTIKAISKAIPDAVEDTDTLNTSFVHRAFLTQYTGTGCGYCPYMIKIIRELMADNTIPGKAVLAAVHSYANSDPAYISAPKVSNYPYMHIDLETGFSHTQGSGPLYSQVNSIAASDAKAGISVNPVLYEDGTLVIKASVKAAVDGEFRIGAWLLEDGIYGQQTDYDSVGDASYSTHENCVRLIDSRYDGSWVGKHLGSIKAGESLDKTFVMNVKRAWKKENLHVAVIVSVKKGNKFVVCNAIDCPIDASTPFDYK